MGLTEPQSFTVMIIAGTSISVWAGITTYGAGIVGSLRRRGVAHIDLPGRGNDTRMKSSDFLFDFMIFFSVFIFGK